MKVLHLADSLNPAGLGGYEAILHYLSAELESLGHKSMVVTQSPERDSLDMLERTHYRLYHLPGNLLEARKWEFFALSEKERTKAVEKLFEPDDLQTNIVALVNQLQVLVDDLRPDIIHAHSTYVVFNRVLETLRQSGSLDSIPLVVSIHGLPKPLVLPNGENTTDYEQLSLSMPFDQVLAVSNNVADTLKQHFSPIGLDDRVVTLHNGVDLSVFHPQKDPIKRWDLAFLGRLETMKSVDLFPEMLARLRRAFPELRMVITGEGSYKVKLLNELDRLGVADMVDYLGVVETDRVPDLINSSRVFMYPSRREPFGLSIIEAMACGIPVVTTNVFGPSEIITHGHDGLAVSPDNIDELVDAVEMLLSDSELQNRIGLNARKTVEVRFGLKHHTEQLLTIYNNLIDRSRPKCLFY
ncbi:MAG: glycosyltransferase family 4 protein [Candidatus Thorarchaeota archaeon]